MKVYIPKYEPDRIGGGWSFTRNLATGLKGDFTTTYKEADIYLIPSASMISREEAQQAKDDGKKIVLRIDNELRNSRNRNTGMSRMKDFAGMADRVVFQSTWAERHLGNWLGCQGRVIMNAVDDRIYHPRGRVKNDNLIFLYSRFNRDETKNWEIARHWYSLIQQQDKRYKLNIVGRFSDELVQYNFDFYRDEKFEYHGVLGPDWMADLYRKSDILLYTYFRDACSNTLIEALMCGMQIHSDPFFMQGSASEIYEKFTKDRDYFKLDRMVKDYRRLFNELV